MVNTQIGQRNTRIRIESEVLSGDGQGGHTKTWAVLAVVWALVEPLTSREALQAQQTTAVLSTAVTIVFRSDISVKQRIRIGPRVLQIESYQDPDGRKDELRLLCSEVQA